MRAGGFPPLILQNDFRDLPFADGAFDALLAFNVIYHTTLDGLRQTLGQIHRVVRPGGYLLISFVGRHERQMAKRRVDVARGVCVQIEPFTFIYVDEIEDDKYLPHHYVDEMELRDLLTAFEIDALDLIDTSYVDDETGTPYFSEHYAVYARRP